MQCIAFVSMKGGVGKTTSAIHYAYWASINGCKTVLIDDDANRSSIKWALRAGENPKFKAPFEVVPFAKMANAAQGMELVVLDTQASIGHDVIKDLAEDCELIVIPSKPDIDSAAAAHETALKVKEANGNYTILLTDCPTGSSKTGAETGADLAEVGLNVLSQRIRRGAGVGHASLAGSTVAQQTGKYRMPWRDYEIAFNEILKIYGLPGNG